MSVAVGVVVEVVMPQMGVSVTEGTVSRWLKRPGDAIASDELLLEISTDKVDTEVPSPGDGILQRILIEEGETVAVGTVLATLAPEGAAAAADPALATIAASVPLGADPSSTPDASGGPALISPVVARMAIEHAIDLSRIRGSGRGGRITKSDVMAFLDHGGATSGLADRPSAPAPAEAPPAAPATSVPVVAPTAPAAAPPGLDAAATAGPVETLVAMTPIRKLTAEHMRRSVDTSAHVTAMFEIDMSRVVSIRSRLKKEYEARHGVNLTYVAFVAHATVKALRDWPWLNGELRGDRIVTRNYVNLGIAVALDGGKGLIVPNIKHAEEKNLLGLARDISDLAERARTKRLLPEDVSGGTFTVTNPGGWGAFAGTPIINQPQLAILETDAMKKRPWVVQDEFGNDTLAIRPIMNLSISFDHRVIDGAYAHQFVKQIRDRLQSWDERQP